MYVNNTTQYILIMMSSYASSTPEKETKFVTNVYNTIANHFSDTRSYQWSWITDFVKSTPPGSNIYDIGCGSGRNMNYEGYKFIGIDSSSAFVDMCLANKQTAVKASMTDIPFDNETADAVMCIAAFHHLSNEERRMKAILEMKRVLKKDGTILLSVWSKNQPKKTRRKFETYGDVVVPWTTHDGNKIERYYYIFDIDEITTLFKKTGLKIVSHSWEVGNEVFILTKSK